MEKKYDYRINEAAIQEQWQQQETYAFNNNTGPLYTIDTPPPTVSGKLHIGHIFSYTQTDIIARFKRMTGHAVFYPFGFDDNGLATERYVEKKNDIRAHTLKRSDFIALCTKESHDSALEFKKLWQKMGLSADWNLTYSTISASTRKISQQSFIDLFNKGHIYRKQEPAIYCSLCRTAVAQAELDDQEVPSFFNDIVFKDMNGNDLIVATTRPELLPACAALLFHPDDIRYQHLLGKKATVPLFGHQVPIFADELVSIEKGTGLVMVCTFGDKTDIVWYKKHNLPYTNIIGFDGKCNENAGFLQGLSVVNARSAVIEALKEKNLLYTQKVISHTVSVHERCKKEVEYIIIPQWFISILAYKKDLLALADTINWHPAFMQSRYNDWVENLAWDWCISRQRFYGIPFPVWHCTGCGHIVLADSTNLPVDPQETAYNKPCPQCSGTSFVADTDVMDTWNTSSITPYICKELYHEYQKQSGQQLSDSSSFLPMSMRPQAHDIIRTWTFDTLVKTWMHDNTAAWKDIVISGHVLTNKKEKISKKDGTATDPLLLLQEYSADAIRYWTASAKLGHDTLFSSEQLKIGQKLITKLWNAFLFIQPHMPEAIDYSLLGENNQLVNKWILHRASESFSMYKKYLEEYEPSLAVGVIDQFFWHDFCDNYIEIVKHQLFNPEEYESSAVMATKMTLYYIGLTIIELYAPYVSHVTESIYQELYKAHEQCLSVHQTRYTLLNNQWVFAHEHTLMNSIITLIDEVRKLKSQAHLSLKTELATLTIIVDDETQKYALKDHEKLIQGVVHAHKTDYCIAIKDNDYQSLLTTESDKHKALIVFK